MTDTSGSSGRSHCRLPGRPTRYLLILALPGQLPVDAGAVAGVNVERRSVGPDGQALAGPPRGNTA